MDPVGLENLQTVTSNGLSVKSAINLMDSESEGATEIHQKIYTGSIQKNRNKQSKKNGDIDSIEISVGQKMCSDIVSTEILGGWRK